MNRQPQALLSVRRRPPGRGGFTLIEVMIVIGIIAVLVTLVTLGVRQMIGGAKEKSTRTTMENLQNLVAEKQVAGGGAAPLDAVFAPGGIVAAPLNITPGNGKDREPKWDNGKPRLPTNAVAATRKVMALLRAVPTNAKVMAALPSGQIWNPPVEAETPNAPLVLDAWGNPIIYVPAGGLTGVTVTGNVKSKYVNASTAFPAGVIQSPDRRGFWASAGADGFFTDPDPSKDLDNREPYGDDNVYSFDQ